ncbi:MAG: hypothetical protein EHM43_00320 [Ignavibacteriae bacterium]|nr:MAG: hypothetical protein EHM43_00320 [Ignavibacteriota bacterium]
MKWLIVVVLVLLKGASVSSQIYNDCREPYSMVFPFMPFSCYPLFILGFNGNSLAPGCLDSMVICIGLPVPPRSPDHPDLEPALLLRGEDTININIRIDEVVGTLTVYPLEPMPITEDDNVTQIDYLIQLNCAYWQDIDTGEKSTYFAKQHIVRSYTVARSLRDSSIVNDRVYVSPPETSPTHYVHRGVNIHADRENGDLTFSHWTSSLTDVKLDPLIATQNVQADCWPIMDTVIFTAWYHDETTSVVDVFDEAQPQFDNAVFSDLTGRVYPDHKSLPPGLYLVRYLSNTNTPRYAFHIAP